MRLLLTEPSAAADLDTFLGRAAAVQDGSVRLIASGQVLAVYVPVLFPASLLDESATVLGLRTFQILPPAEPVDALVPITSLRARVQGMSTVQEGFELGVPTPVYSVTWAGIVPPQGGWTASGSVSSLLLRAAADHGIAEVAQAVPTNAGEQVVRQLRSLVWNAPVEGADQLPAGAAFAAHALGFLPAVDVEPESAGIYEVGPWTRVSMPRGHVLIKRRVWSLAG